VRNPNKPPPLTERQILRWARAHRRRHGTWPAQQSGPVEGVPGERWPNIDHALTAGLRGLPGSSSLARLLAATCGKRNHMRLAPLTPDQVLAWGDSHYRRTGRWPRVKSGCVKDAAGESWSGIDNALRGGYRGLPGGDSLYQLLRRARGVRKPANRRGTGRKRA
jgi:hypothetical protein